ncbi:hypothetical protein GCM10009102_31230 [Sphingomonas insulae]|uniref:PsiF repeat-containing protein n=3 Tax=Sphingomonas insulae TaxID=424800 RepID=A0ABN1HZV6_9SPHN
MSVVTMMLAMVAGGTPAMAQATPSPAVVTPAKDEPKICKRMEQTGSRMGASKRVCHTAEEWRQLESNSFSRNVNGAGAMRGTGQN